jgi:hypothetical protein
MVPRLTPAFAHLSAKGSPGPTLTIRVWDADSTGSPPPPIPSAAVRESTSPRFVYRSGDVRGIAQPVEGSYSLFDPGSGEALYWVTDARSVPYYETAAPVRHILSWWGAANDRPLVHAGAVGTVNGGVLLVGRGGSGKSTTALSCLGSGLRYVGDDYVLAEPGPRPVAHALYGTGKLQPDNLHRLPDLRPAISNLDRLPEEKAVVFVAEHFPDRIASSLPIRAVLVPRLDGRGPPRIVPASPATALAAVAPSTILQLPGTGQESMDAMARLLERIPAYSISLSENLAENVRSLDGLISSLTSDR